LFNDLRANSVDVPIARIEEILAIFGDEKAEFIVGGVDKNSHVLGGCPTAISLFKTNV